MYAVSPDGMAGGLFVMSAGERGTELKEICETVTGFGLWFKTLRTTELGPVTEYESTITFSGLENEPVIVPAHTATAIPNATATAMRITVAMTGLTALVLFKVVMAGRA